MILLDSQRWSDERRKPMKIDIENPQAVLEDILTRINNGEYVKVVRCKDCKFSGGYDCNHPSGLAHITENDYCSCGRREEKTDEKD